jgi:hypothetical protein
LDDTWRMVDGLINRAHSIVLLLPPGHPVRAGLVWEVQRIAARDRQRRVVIVFPPHKSEKKASCPTWHHALLVLAVLQEYPCDANAAYRWVLTNSKLLRRDDGRTPLVLKVDTWGALSGGWAQYPKARCTGRSYHEPIVDAVQAIELDLPGTFDDRYPPQQEPHAPATALDLGCVLCEPNLYGHPQAA